jgi:type IV secretory pathway TrbF-like protein
MARNRQDLARLIEQTLWHEIAHHFWDERAGGSRCRAIEEKAAALASLIMLFPTPFSVGQFITGWAVSIAGCPQWSLSLF